jgi:parallel beta-helix repeat protein
MAGFTLKPGITEERSLAQLLRNPVILTGLQATAPSGDTSGATDTPRLQVAAALGLELVLGQGTYWVNATVQLVGPSLRGAKGGTTLKQAAGTNLAGGVLSAAGSNQSIRDLTIDGNKANVTGGAGIIATAAAGLSVLNCRVVNTYGRSVDLNATTDATVSNCEIVNPGHDNTTEGIRALNATRTRILGNRVNGPAGNGIAVGGSGTAGSGSTIATIANNIVDSGGFIGIATGGSSGVTVTGNVISNCPNSNAIDTGNSQHVTVTGNRCTGSGICSDGSSAPGTALDQVYVGNTIDAGNGDGILLIFVDGFTVSGNISDRHHTSGIALQGCTNGQIVGNVCKNGQTAFGIQLSGTNSHLTIAFNRCYDNQTTKTQAFGIVTAATDSLLRIIGNDLVGNLSSGFINNATSVYTSGNAGYNPVGFVSPQPAMPASGTVVTNTTTSDVTVHIAGGTGVGVAIAGVATGLTSGSFRIPAGQSITPFYATAPTWTWFGD